MTSAQHPIPPAATLHQGAEKPISPQYSGKKGQVQVAITNHCRIRFRERWVLAFPHKPLRADIDEEIARRFNRATRIIHLGPYEKRRMARHGKDSLYFRGDGLTFIVQDRVIVTVELSGQGTRHLNKGALAA